MICECHAIGCNYLILDDAVADAVAVRGRVAGAAADCLYSHRGAASIRTDEVRNSVRTAFCRPITRVAK